MLQLGPAADVTRCVAHVSAPPDEMSALIRRSHFHYDSYYVAQKLSGCRGSGGWTAMRAVFGARSKGKLSGFVSFGTNSVGT